MPERDTVPLINNYTLRNPLMMQAGTQIGLWYKNMNKAEGIE